MLERKISTLEKIHVVLEKKYTLSLTSISIYQNDSYTGIIYTYMYIPWKISQKKTKKNNIHLDFHLSNGTYIL